MVWCLVLGYWSLHIAGPTNSGDGAAVQGTDTPRLHKLMLFLKGRMRFSRRSAPRSIFIARSTRRAPSSPLSLLQGLAVLLGGGSFITALRYTRPDFPLLNGRGVHAPRSFLHAFPRTRIAWLLSGVGLCVDSWQLTKTKTLNGGQNQAASHHLRLRLRWLEPLTFCEER